MSFEMAAATLNGQRTEVTGLDLSPRPFQPSAKDLHARIGGAIRRRRRAIDVTLLELAQVCGVSFQQVQKYESGACAISAAQLWTMACALGVPVSYFYEGDPTANG
jgi:hypothetical protein